MMYNRYSKALLIIFLFLELALNLTIASEFRIQSLGNTRLALLDEDNNLNLYNAVHNPAYLLFDEKTNWLKFYSGGDYAHTSLKRAYDPAKQQNLFVTFEGIKILGQHQIFWGKVNYRFNRKYQVSHAIEPNPYNDDPLVLTDTTTGNVYTDSPVVQVAYHNQILPKIGIGVEMEYDISTGLKKQYTRPRTIHRNFEGKIGITYRLRPNLVWGSYLKAAFLQDQIELVTSWDGKTIYTLRYRSESVYRVGVGNYDRYMNLDGFRFNTAVQYVSPDKNSRHLLEFNYFNRKQKVVDKFPGKFQTDSPWFNFAIGSGYRGRYIFNRLVLGLKINYLYAEDWSKHPDYPLLITERHKHQYQVAGGISYQFPRILLISEAGFFRAKIDYRDYQSAIHRQGVHDFYTAKFGLEFRFDPIHFVRGGFNYDYFYPDFSSPRYLPEHAFRYFSLGLSEQRAKYTIEFHFDYLLKNAANSSEQYNGWNALIFTRIPME